MRVYFHIFILLFSYQTKEEGKNFCFILSCQTCFPRGESLSRKRTILKEMTAKFYIMRCLCLIRKLLLRLTSQIVYNNVSDNEEATNK